ncbi:MAG: GNAT family N-acetyltransferase [Solirubrobacterales bacterium]|nr:GNAT family N-acetyltransferase [Solirubrobacterales bacterium]
MPTRLANVEDSEVLAQMLHDFNEEFGDPSPGVEVLASRVRRFIDRSTKIYLLAREDGAASAGGFAQISFTPSIWSEGPIAMIDELYVRPALRRRGLGQELMDSILALAREQGANGVEVVTGEDDLGARALYEKTGFRNEIEGEKNSRSLFYEREL